ncbi:hypothetical protein BKA82DRAFT_3030734 [Pisolithus tinctorius]|nr:hypothetical protein BKA82DRAFT_3030734 [Pisolithus tinctorius]
MSSAAFAGFSVILVAWALHIVTLWSKQGNIRWRPMNRGCADSASELCSFPSTSVDVDPRAIANARLSASGWGTGDEGNARYEVK